MRFGDNIDLDQIDNWLEKTRNMGDVINIPWSLFEKMFDYKKTTYALTYLKLRYLSQDFYGSFKKEDFKNLAKCIGLSQKTLKSHIKNLIQLNWLREKHEGFYQLVSFHEKSYTKVLKLTAEQIFSVKNSKNLERTRLTFGVRENGKSAFSIVKIKEATSLSIQEFRILLTEISIELDSTQKKKIVKYYDNKSNKSKNLTSPTKWERDCTKKTRHIGSRFVAKRVGISQRTILKYRKKSNSMNLSSYERRLFKITNPVLLKAVDELKIHGLNDYAKEYCSAIPTQLVGFYFINNKGHLMKNQIAYRRSKLNELRFTGIIRGVKSKKKLEIKEDFKLDVSSIPFYEPTIEGITIPDFVNSKIEEQSSRLNYLESLEVKTESQKYEFNILKNFSYDKSFFTNINPNKSYNTLPIYKKFELLKSVPEEFLTDEDEFELRIICQKLTKIELKLNSNTAEKGLFLRYYYDLKFVPTHILEYFKSK